MLLEKLVRNLVDNGVRHGRGTLEIATGEPAARVASGGERLDEAQSRASAPAAASDRRSSAPSPLPTAATSSRARGRREGLAVEIALPT